MPKKLPQGEQTSDPVRSRLQSNSRLASLASQAAAAPKKVAEPTPAPEPEYVEPPEPAPARPARQQYEPPPQAPFESRPVSRPPARRGATYIRKAQFTSGEIEANAELMHLLSRLTSSKPSEGCMTRVLWSLLREAEAPLKSLASSAPQLRRPPNGAGIEMAEYERDLARFVIRALKSVEL